MTPDERAPFHLWSFLFVRKATTIHEVDPGERHAGACISDFYFNRQEFGAANEIGRIVVTLSGRFRRLSEIKFRLRSEIRT